MAEQEELFHSISSLLMRVDQATTGDPFVFKQEARESFYATNLRLLERVKSEGRITEEDVAELRKAVDELLKPHNRVYPEEARQEAEKAYYQSQADGIGAQPWDLKGDWKALEEKILSTSCN